MKKNTFMLLSLALMVATTGSAQKKKVKKAKKAGQTVEVSAVGTVQTTSATASPMAVVDSTAGAKTPKVDSVAVIPEEPQDRIDTIYYNKNWKVTKNKAFASYYRLALYPADTQSSKEFKTYYMSGELQGEGNFLELDKTDDAKSQLNDQVTIYFKNGDIKEQKSYVNGKLQGEYTSYYNNEPT